MEPRLADPRSRHRTGRQGPRARRPAAPRMAHAAAGGSWPTRASSAVSPASGRVQAGRRARRPGPGSRGYAVLWGRQLGGRRRAALSGPGSRPSARIVRGTDRCSVHPRQQLGARRQPTSPRCCPELRAPLQPGLELPDRGTESDTARFQLFDSTTTFLRERRRRPADPGRVDRRPPGGGHAVGACILQVPRQPAQRDASVGRRHVSRCRPGSRPLPRDRRADAGADDTLVFVAGTRPGGRGPIHRRCYRGGPQPSCRRGCSARDEGQPAVRDRGGAAVDGGGSNQ